jgi:hypothetical protein
VSDPTPDEDAAVKISDLLGEGWEAEESTGKPAGAVADAAVDPTADRAPLEGATSEAVAPEGTEAGGSAATAPGPDRQPVEVPTSARAQLAELAAGLAPAPAESERAAERTSAEQLDDLAEVMGLARAVDAGATDAGDEAKDGLVGLGPVVDDLLPGVRTPPPPRGASRSGSRRRGR